MSKLKETMIKGMDKIMLNCDQATFLATQNSVEKIGCLNRIQLRLHLMGCKLCRNFVKQSEIIMTEIEKTKENNPNEFEVHLNGEQKEKLQHSIENELK